MVRQDRYSIMKKLEKSTILCLYSKIICNPDDNLVLCLNIVIKAIGIQS
jgi:hypothetical protein